MPLTPEQYADQFTAALQTYIADSDEEAFSDAYAAIWTNAVTGGTSILRSARSSLLPLVLGLLTKNKWLHG